MRMRSLPVNQGGGEGPLGKGRAAAPGFAVLLAAVLLFAGCDAFKGLFGEDPGTDIGGSGSSIPVVFEDIEVAPAGTTTLVSLVFDKDIPGLSEDDITLEPGGTNAAKGVLAPTDVAGVYTLAVSGITETGPVTVSVAKSGYAFTPASLSTVVNRDEAQTVLFNATPNGAAGSQTTDALALSFNAAFATPLQQSDITLWTGSTGATAAGLSGSGTDCTLGITGVAAEGEVFVTVVKDGYAVSPATVRVPVHYLVPLATGGTVTYDPPVGIPQWEIHTFEADGTLTFDAQPSLTAWVLVVAGGGGGGSGVYRSGGGGAGGVVENTSYSLTKQSYNVVVGTGGAGGLRKDTSSRLDGTNGGFSQFGQDEQVIKAYGGGGGGSSQWSINIGLAGGSSGGGNTSPAVIAGEGGTSYGYIGGETKSGGNSSPGAGGGGAGGQGTSGGSGGPGISNSISGKPVTYAAGGGIPASAQKIDGAPNTGNGGSGAWNSSGGNGGSGIVIVRFQRPN